MKDDVRDRAAQAAYATTAISPYPGWADLKEEWREQLRREVDAVVAVVAPEIERPLQARIEELEALAGMWESRAKEVDAHRRALWDITGRDPKVWSAAHARAVLAKGGKS